MAKLSGIPTEYRGIRFRSMLEARWANTFDLIGWKWEYEPLELNGYIPDFILRFKNPVLVEIKPVTEFDEFSIYTEKIERSGWDGESLILGAMPDYPEGSHANYTLPTVGLYGQMLWDEHEKPVGICWARAVLFRCLICHRVSIHHSEQSFRCLVGGCYDGCSHIGSITPKDWSEVWTGIKNHFQYRRAA